jgi:hypothetical protein
MLWSNVYILQGFGRAIVTGEKPRTRDIILSQGQYPTGSRRASRELRSSPQYISQRERQLSLSVLIVVWFLHKCVATFSPV